MAFDFDLFVIGAGSGGVRAARLSAGFGARVAIAEERYLGGTCVNVGCIPKKLFVYAAHFSEDMADARSFGWDIAEPRFDWRALISNKNREIARLNGVYERFLKDAGARIIDGRARLLDANTVAMGGSRFTAEHILIATGGWPHIPDIPGREHVLSSNDMFFLDELPKRALVVGGGYVAAEFAGILNGLGVETTLAYRGPLFLRGFDVELREFLAGEMLKKGIRVMFNTAPSRIDKAGEVYTASMTTGHALTADRILFATGRRPNTLDLGLESAGVRLRENGGVMVNQNLQTTVPSVFAIGDVTDRINLTPVATAEGTALARTLFGGQATTLDYGNIPTCIFTQPNLAAVGLTEEQARATLPAVAVYRSTFTPLKHTLSGRAEKTLVKMIVNRETNRVVGVHMVGPDAGEIIQGMAVAVKAGATKAVFDSTIGIHPTLAEELVTLRDPSD